MKIIKEQISVYRVGWPFWTGLTLIAGIPRIIGAFLLPNAFGDAYSYLEAIEGMRSKMVDGSFAIKDLYGFWFPMYQFICAAASFVFGHTFYTAKLVSAIFGVGACLLVYQITLRLTNHRRLSLAAFALAALNPLHIFYSSSALTDVPHGFLVMGALYFAIEKRWNTAAIFAAAAGFTRIESWMLILFLPAFKFLYHRRISLALPCIMIVSPILWFYICWKATGNLMAYFDLRHLYISDYTAANPFVWTFSPQRLRLDLHRLLLSTNLAELLSCLAASWIIFRRIITDRLFRQKFDKVPQDFAGLTISLVLYFSYLGFLSISYLSGSQQDIWSRYGLIFFTMGLPVTAWMFKTIIKERPKWKLAMAMAILAVSAYHIKDQIGEAVTCMYEDKLRKIVAVYLKERRQKDPGFKVYCDDGNVRAQSGIPLDRFLTAYNLPSDRETALKRFDEVGLRYVVCGNLEHSKFTKMFPALRDGKGDDLFHPVAQASSNKSQLELWVYRFR